MLALLLFVGWQSLRKIRDTGDRGEFIAALLFLSMMAIISSPLMVSAYTRMDPYGLFLLFGPDRILASIGGSLAVNVLISYAVSVLFLTLYYRLLYRDFESIESCTFGSVLPPFVLAYGMLFLISQRGAEAYFLTAFFPMVIAFLGVVGYSHPKNKTDLFIAKALMAVCIGCLVVGFVLAMGGLLFYLTFLMPEAPVAFETLLWSGSLDWSQLGYPAESWVDRFRPGFIWMVLASSMFLMLVVGVPTTLAIYHFQYLPALSEDRSRRVGNP